MTTWPKETTGFRDENVLDFAQVALCAGANDTAAYHHSPTIRLFYTGKTWNSSWKINWFNCTIPLGTLQKIGAVIWGKAILPLFLVCSVNLDAFCSLPYSHHPNIFSFMFMHKFSTQALVVQMLDSDIQHLNNQGLGGKLSAILLDKSLSSG